MKGLSFEILYYFATLVQTAHFGDAADKLFITQQALSKRMAQLESDLQTELIARQEKSFALTESGQAFYQQALQVLEQLQKIEHRFLPEQQSQVISHLRIAGVVIPLNPVGTVLKLFLKANPHLTLDLQQNYLVLSHIEQALLHQDLDCAFVLAPPHTDGLAYRQIGTLSFGIAKPFSMQWVPWQDLPFMAYYPFGLTDYQDIFWPEVLDSVSVVGEVDFPIARQLCLAGQAALFLPRNFIRDDLVRKRLLWAEDFPYVQESPVYMIWNPACPHPFVQELLKQC